MNIEDNFTIAIDNRLFGRDFDDVDNEINNQLIQESTTGDNDEEAFKYGY